MPGNDDLLNSIMSVIGSLSLLFLLVGGGGGYLYKTIWGEHEGFKGR
jgi:hypothetical protein